MHIHSTPTYPLEWAPEPMVSIHYTLIISDHRFRETKLSEQNKSKMKINYTLEQNDLAKELDRVPIDILNML